MTQPDETALNDIRIAEKQEIERYRTRVQFLSQDLWETTDKTARVNLLIQLADAVTSLLHLESRG
jgi:hypothetical protein